MLPNLPCMVSNIAYLFTELYTITAVYLFVQYTSILFKLTLNSLDSELLQ